jgi:AraC-like DNA-binding protein
MNFSRRGDSRLQLAGNCTDFTPDEVCSKSRINKLIVQISKKSWIMDVLSQYLGTFQIRQALCTRFEVTAPWGHEVVNFSQVKFVLVANGSCWLRTQALPEPTLLGNGDLFLVLNGEPYRLSDRPKSKTIDCRELEKRRKGFVIEHGGGGAPCTLVSVAMAIETLDGQPAHLPSFIHLRVDQTRSLALQSLIDLMRMEVSSAAIGSTAIVQRLSEVLFISAVRAHAQSAQPSKQDVFAAMADQQLGVALSSMYGDSARDWTLTDLAKSANMSRSAFAARFKSVVGQSPLEFLTQHRMHKAGQLMRSGFAIADVANRVGYDSDISFARAFKRVMGRTPGRFKRATPAV